MDILAALTQTGIRQTAAGGKARAFCDIVGDKIGEMETKEFVNLGETLIHYFTGEDLDFIGEIFGVYRVGAQVASIAQGDTNFKFYAAGGKTFGDINSGSDITVPAGTLIMTAAQAGPIFLTDTLFTLRAADKEQFVSAYSASPGSSANAAAGVFNRWSGNFTYSNAAFGSLLVTNAYGVVGGRDDESDDNYRYRIQQKLQGRNGANEAALRFELLQVPGIQDIGSSARPERSTVTCMASLPRLPLPCSTPFSR